MEAGHRVGIPVGMCGELAGKPDAAAPLIGLGLDELSMNASSVPEVKAAIHKLSAEECRNLAEKALEQDDGDEVLQLLINFNRSAYTENFRILDRKPLKCQILLNEDLADIPVFS